MAALVGVAVIVVGGVLFVTLRGGSATTGYDASYPQCSGSDASKPLFGIVGVDGGLANNANPCLGDELQWARGAPGQKRPQQPPLSLYIDTGNPGAHHVADWPRGGATPLYGACNGKLTNACSYLYGVQRAAHSYSLVAALDPAAATTAPWWLDVELAASWAGTYELNIAALRGFVAGPAQRRRDRADRDLLHQRPVARDHGADRADDASGLRRPAARLGGRNQGHARAGAEELHKRRLHRRAADARAVSNRRAGCRSALRQRRLSERSPRFG